MAREKVIVLPKLRRILAELGENIRFARLRRKYSAAMVAARAGIARNTLRGIERGDPRVTFGAYANVLLVLGLVEDLKLVAKDDVLGRKLQDANLPIKVRVPRRTRTAIKKIENE